MNTSQVNSIRAVAFLILTGLTSGVWAQAAKTPPAPALPAGTVLIVNGAAITEKDIDKMVGNMQSQNRPVTPQLREQATAELMVRHVLMDEVKRQKLDTVPALVERVEEFRQRLLVDTMMNDYLTKNPITEADEKAEYDRQKKVLGGGDTTQQYQLRQVLVKTDQEGRDLIARAQKGEAFDKLAALSIDEASKANGGLIGWVFPTDLFPALGAVVVNLQKGAVAAAPIQSNAGWHVIKLEDIRPYKIPGFEESRPQIKQALLNQRRQALIDNLMKKAVVKRP